MSSCAAPDQNSGLSASVDVEKETIITGRVRTVAGDAVPGAFVRLLDKTGEFTAEVVASTEGAFRFFAAPGTWTVRALSPRGKGDQRVVPERAGVHNVDVAVG